MTDTIPLNNKSPLFQIPRSHDRTDDFLYQNSSCAEFVDYMNYYVQVAKDYKRVLVIEDDPISYKIIQSYIKNFNPEVRCFHSTDKEESEQIITTYNCDLVIADYFLKGERTGLQICEELLRKIPKVACVIISSLKSYQFQEIAQFANQILPFYEKPLSQKKISRLLSETLFHSSA